MAQQGPEVSSTTVSNTWWDSNFIHAHNPFPSWPAAATMISRCPSSSRFSEAAADMAVTTTSVSNASVNASCSHSALSMDDSSADGLSGEPMENSHIWNQVLLDEVNNAGEVPSRQHDAENFLRVLGSRSLTTELCHIDGSAWGPHRASLSYLDKHSGYEGSVVQAGNNLPDLVSNWSIAPPNSNFDASSMAAAAAPCSAFLGPDSSTTDYFASHAKHGRAAASPSYPTNLILEEGTSNYVDGAVASALLARPYGPGGGRYQIGHGDLTPELPSWCNQRNLSDQMSPFGGHSSKPAAVELRDPKQGFESSSASGRGTGTIEGKKKRCADSAELKLKKTKLDSSTVDSAIKLQVPKVRIAEKISALQQFVSPFGKTDQASVLTETLKHIRILQEQIQLLTGPCLKSSVNKEHTSWGEMGRNENPAADNDLRSKGLCLVPVSSIHQVYRESSRPDYWMPPYRACFYR